MFGSIITRWRRDAATPRSDKAAPPRWRRNKGVAFIVSALLAVGTAATYIAPANALPAGVANMSLDYGGARHNGDPVVSPGQDYNLRFNYIPGELVAGSQIVLKVPEGVTFPSIDVPDANKGHFSNIEVNGDGDLVFTIAASPAAGQQTLFDLKFRFDNPENGSEIRNVEWEFGGTQESAQLIVRKSGDNEFKPNLSNSLSDKSVSVPWSFNNAISVTGTHPDRSVVVNPNVVGEEVTYTVKIESTELRNGVDITDTLHSLMEYVPGSFVSTLYTWDDNGLNRQATPWEAPDISGNTFAYSDANLPADSRLEITYRARVADAAALQSQLQAALQAAQPADEDAGFNFSVPVTNDLDVTGYPGDSAPFNVSGSVAAAPDPTSPNLGTAFGKSASPSSHTISDTDLDGPKDVTYIFKANLTEWDGRHSINGELNQNVVIGDNLPSWGEWKTSDSNFISGGYTQATDFSGTAADFAADEYVGQWAVIGQQLFINVGQDTETNVNISVKAQIVELGPENASAGKPEGIQTVFQNTNTATYYYGASSNYNRSATVTFNDRGDTSDGIKDTSKFDKRGPDNKIEAIAGQSINIPYTFVVNGVDFAKSRIIDYVDHTIFDLSDLSAVQISGSYNHNGPINADSVELSVDGEGNLIVEPSAEFTNAWPDWMSANPPYDQRLQLVITLPTKPLAGGQVLNITNKARLLGGDNDEINYFDEATQTADTHGATLEARKSAYNPENAAWEKNLRAVFDESTGKLINDTFVYRIELVPHGNYNNIPMIEVTDPLPAGLTFLGFVSDSALSNPDIPTVPGDTYDLGGNITATWENDTVVLSSGTNNVSFNGSTPRHMNFKVQITNPELGVPIVNRLYIGDDPVDQQTITPGDEYPLVINKVNGANPGDVITDLNARFTVTGPSGAVVTDEAYVVDGYVVVPGSNPGEHATILVDKPGAYTVTENVAPAGFELATDSVVITVEEGVNPDTAVFVNWPGTSPTAYFTVAKELENPDGVDGTPSSFEIEYSVDGGSVWRPLAVASSGVSTVPVSVTPGATVLVREVAPAEISGATWAAPAWSATSATAVAPVPASAQHAFSVADGATAALTVTNTITADAPDVGSFTVAKTLVNEDNVAGVPSAYDIEYRTSADGDTWSAWTDVSSGGVSAGAAAVAIGDLVVGTQVQIRENAPADVVGATWGAVDISSASFTITAAEVDTPLAVTVTNTITADAPEVGSFTVAKTLVNEDNVAGLPDTYDIVYRTSADGVTWSDWAEVAAGGVVAGASPVSVGNLPVGTRVEIDENLPGPVSGATWGWADISPAIFTITDAEVDTPLAVTVINTITENTKTYAIGDFTWIDLNKDGVQDDDEPVLVGVTVNLLDADGNPFLVDGEPVTTTTDENGRYLFDELPAGDYRVEFVLTPEQSAVYKFTEQNSDGSDNRNGSDADVATGRTGVITLDDSNAELTANAAYDFGTVLATEGIDPTWDAGVVFQTGLVSLAKTVAGANGDDVEFSFTWTATLPDAFAAPLVPQFVVDSFITSGSVTVNGDGAAVVLSNEGEELEFPAGTVVTFTEDAAPAISGYTFAGVEFTGNGLSVSDGTVGEVGVTNTYTEIPQEPGVPAEPEVPEVPQEPVDPPTTDNTGGDNISTDGNKLPVTGSNSGAIGLFALALLVAGGTAVFFARRYAS